MSTALKKSRNKSHATVVRMVQLALLTAIVLVLQLTGTAIRIPFLGTSVSLVLIPIAIGAMLTGPWGGAWLGLVFGAVAYIGGGVLAMDPFTTFLFQDAPVVTALICFGKGALAGFLTGLVYKLLREKNQLLAVFLAAAVTPVVNTGIFILGCFTILGTIEGFMAAAGLGGTAIYFLFIGCAGWNFIFEFLFNMIFAPSIERIVRLVERKFAK